MAENRKSAARMKTYRRKDAQGDGSGSNGTPSQMRGNRPERRSDDASRAFVISTSSVPRDEYERINAHRMPIATWVHDVTREHAKKTAERHHARIMQRARRQMRHPYARQHATAIAIVVAFAIVAIGGIAIGNDTVRSANAGTAANASDTTSIDSLSTTRTQREALVATGLYDTFMLSDGIPMAELLDGNVTPSEVTARQAILDARAQKPTEEASAGRDEADDTDNAMSGDELETDGSTNAQGGLGNASGTLTSDQANEGRQKVMDALNQYTGSIQDATNAMSDQVGAMDENGSE